MLKKIAHLIENEVDDFRSAVEKLTGGSKDIEIKPYLSFGSEQSVFVRGRVLDRKRTPDASADDSRWKNFLNASRKWFSDEVPHARLQATLGAEKFEFQADDEGYFLHQILLPDNTAVGSGKVNVLLSLLEPEDTKGTASANAEVLIPVAGSEFGIISDIDDTVIETGATHLMTMVKNTLLGNAHTRVVFEGVAALYEALGRGMDGRGKNPFFYVTSSPWNLYDLLTHVFELGGLPPGPLFMTDWGIDDSKFLKSGHHTHKKSAIATILNTYPEMKFILLGDSGQEDPEIYTDLLAEFPERILAVYIRDVTPDDRDAAVRALAEKAVETGVELVLAEDSNAIARHAAEKSYIRESELLAIAGRVAADKVEAG